MVKKDTILIVDDQELNRVILRNVFEEEYNLLEAENGEQALLLVAQYHENIAALLLDLVMPIKDGYQVLKELDEKNMLGSLPVIVITAEDSAENEVRAFDLGASDIIMKPFEPYVVHRRVQNVIELNLRKLNQQEIIEDQAQKLRESNSTMIDALSSIIEYRSVETGQHIHRIRLFTEVLLSDVARCYPEFALDSRKLSMIASASSMHDIGKIAIPDSILNKPGRLTDEEYEIMKTHTTKGCDMLANLDRMSDKEYLQYAYNICRYHHERWDGRGYPDGLKGESIPICAQVVGIADCYDALTSDRVYKKAFIPEKAYNMILNGECGSFSPKLLECFKNVRAAFEQLTMEYSDSNPHEPKFKPHKPVLSFQEDETLQMGQYKYFTLLQYMNSTVVELDCTKGFYHVVYLADNIFASLKTGSSFESAFKHFVESAVSQEDKKALLEDISQKTAAFFSDGIMKQRRRFRVYSKDAAGYVWCEETWLRVNTEKPLQKKALIVYTLLSEALPEKEEPLASLPENPPKQSFSREKIDLLGGVEIVHYDKWLTLENMSPWLEQLLGYTKEEIKNTFQNHLIHFVYPADVETVQQQIDSQLKKGKISEAEFRLVRKDGSVVWVLGKCRLFSGSDGEDYLQCVLVDISRLRAAQDELRKMIERHQIILDQSNDIIFEWNPVSDTMAYSTNWEKKFGYTPIKDHVSEKLLRISHIHPQDISTLEQMASRLRLGPAYEEIQLRLAGGDGRYRWCKVRATSLTDEQGTVYKIVGLLMDIDAEKRATQILKDEAQRDGLTRLYNKNISRKKIEAMLAELDSKDKAALFIIDMDNFKRINDNYGHMFGDVVLQDFAGELAKLFRTGDIIARIGGDEFLVFMNHIPDEEIVKARAKLIIEASHKIFKNNQIAFTPSCSIGVSFFAKDGQNYEDLFQRSDEALYEAKAKGKNTFVIYRRRKRKNGELLHLMPGHGADTMIESYESPKDTMHKLVDDVLNCLCRADDPKQAIDEVLKAVGRGFDVSRAYIFEESKDKAAVTNSFEWCSYGVVPKKQDFVNYSYERFGGRENYLKLFDEDGIFVCPDAAKLPEYYRKLLSDGRIKSVFQCAMFEGSRFIGFIGFDDCRIIRFWNPDQIKIFSTIAKIISVYLSKKN